MKNDIEVNKSQRDGLDTIQKDFYKRRATKSVPESKLI